MEQINLWLAALGGLALVLGLGAGVMASRPYLLSEPIVGVAAGVAVGPYGLDILRLTPVSDPLPLLEALARITVGFAVTSIALRLDPAYFRDRARSLAVLLGPGMIGMWAVGTLAAYFLLSVEFLVALLIGAVLTPTDPVLANSIVAGKTAEENIPARLRNLVSGEAGVNDGAAYPFVLLPVIFLARPFEAGMVEWVATSILQGVVGAIVAGALIGVIVGRVERWVSNQEFIEETSAFTLTVALTFFVLGVTKILGTDDILAVFVAGIAYNWQAEIEDEAKEQRVEEVFNRLFTIPVFVVLGMVLPWDGWFALGWRGPALVAGVLLLRRLPIVLALRRAVEPLDRDEAALFVGWFGPMGVAAVFYAIMAAKRTGTEMVWVAGSLVVAGSVLAHGATAVPGTLWYGRVEDES